MRNKAIIGLGLTAFIIHLSSFVSHAAQTAFERAIQSELLRAKTQLKDDGYPGIYYAAVNIWDLDEWARWSAMGAPRVESTTEQRIVLPDIRVGSPALDNHPTSPRNNYYGVPIAMDDDEFSLRHSLWRILDGAYKSATADFLRKQERFVAQGKAEYDTDDMTMELPVISTSSRVTQKWDLDQLKRLESALSEPFRSAPDVLYAESHSSLKRLRMRHRDTEGSLVDRLDDWAKIDIEIVALSSDGLRQTVSRDWSVRTPSELPSEIEMRRSGQLLLKDLQELRTAVTTSPFSAPALIDPSVAAALIFALGQRLTGEEQRNPTGAQTFRGRVGQKILSADLTLVDDPTQKMFQGRHLVGHYEYDDQGVPARRVTLVERGILKGFLLSRYPVKGYAHSNGHGRAPIGQLPMGTPGNLILTSENPQLIEKLLDRLREESRRRGVPYGLWVRQLRGATQQQGTNTQGSIRFSARIDLVPVDGGKPLRTRDLDLVGTPLVMAESIVAAGNDVSANVNDSNVFPMASIITPSLLLSEAELQRSVTKPEKAPILKAPEAYLPQSSPDQKPRRIPFVPKGAYIQVNRYWLAGFSDLISDFEGEGVSQWRQTRTPDGLYLDVKITGPSLISASQAVKKIDTRIAALVKGGVHKTVLSPMRTLVSYRARYDDDWPDEGPK